MKSARLQDTRSTYKNLFSMENIVNVQTVGCQMNTVLIGASLHRLHECLTTAVHLKLI